MLFATKLLFLPVFILNATIFRRISNLQKPQPLFIMVKAQKNTKKSNPAWTFALTKLANSGLERDHALMGSIKHFPHSLTLAAFRRQAPSQLYN